ncbi:hypothetical protein NC651_027850 [Populus alba x Populus x berolinensis]|nr:hypothetical protein NC651_027850 [Populus alba x Populus x berolinensis]
MTRGKSKLIPLIDYIFCIFPWRRSYPLQLRSLHQDPRMMAFKASVSLKNLLHEWSDIPLLKTLMSIGFMPKYSNTAIPCTGLVEWNASFKNCILRRYLDRVFTKMA